METERMIRQPDGDFRPDPGDTPTHHWSCDGAGWTRGAVEDSLPVACLVCRPHLKGRVGVKRRHARVLTV